MLRGFLFLLVFLVSFQPACAPAKVVEAEVIVVRVPPPTNASLSEGENQCRFSFWWHPPKEKDLDISQVCTDAAIPHDGMPLFVQLKENGDLTLNGETNGSLADPRQLTARLSNIFEQRSQNGVFAPESSNIEKSVGVRIPATARYADAIDVLRAVRKSGSDPLILFLHEP